MKAEYKMCNLEIGVLMYHKYYLVECVSDINLSFHYVAKNQAQRNQADSV